jgi:Asp-tRNA(Asn)/Glu-tRNA(Gln) amidotransferase A subunit family amidase
LASDVSGSARTSASFCGLFAHHPTSGLVKNDVGPVGRHAEDLLPVLKALVADNFEAADKLRLDEEVGGILEPNPRLRTPVL